MPRFGRRLHIEALEAREMFAVVPTGFTESQVATGLTSPTSIVVAPDGHIFIAQQNGTIRIAHDDGLNSQPFATLSVDSSGERGLTGITLDPNFASNGYVYVYYTASSPSSHNRLSRLTAQGDTMVPDSEVILFELPNLSTVNNPIYHMGGAIHFGPFDGKLYVSVGDHQDTSKPQSLNSPFGKILRINPDGSIPTDNPFYNTTTGINRAIYAYGLRNPFTTAFQPETGLFYLNDVGQSDWEEINEGFAGANYGWPSTEGDFNPSQFPNYTPPVYAYSHDEGCSIVGGTFYPQLNGQFPSQYAGKYFFQDFCSGKMYYLDPANPAAVSTFATDIEFPIDLTVDSEGSLYYLSRGDRTGGQAPGQGGLFKIAYTAGIAPQIIDQPDSQLVSVGFSANFAAAASGSSPLSYQWQRSESGTTTWTNIPGANSDDVCIGVNNARRQWRPFPSAGDQHSRNSNERSGNVDDHHKQASGSDDHAADRRHQVQRRTDNHVSGYRQRQRGSLDPGELIRVADRLPPQYALPPVLSANIGNHVGQFHDPGNWRDGLGCLVPHSFNSARFDGPRGQYLLRPHAEYGQPDAEHEHSRHPAQSRRAAEGYAVYGRGSRGRPAATVGAEHRDGWWQVVRIHGLVGRRRTGACDFDTIVKHDLYGELQLGTPSHT